MEEIQKCKSSNTGQLTPFGNWQEYSHGLFVHLHKLRYKYQGSNIQASKPEVYPRARQGVGMNAGGSQVAAHGTSTLGSCSTASSSQQLSSSTWESCSPPSPCAPASAAALWVAAAQVWLAGALDEASAVSLFTPCAVISAVALARQMRSMPPSLPSGWGGTAAAHSWASSCRATHDGAAPAVSAACTREAEGGARPRGCGSQCMMLPSLPPVRMGCRCCALLMG
eukprot:1156048-Pelagomonas_calceolata.AAC.9